MVLKYSGDIWLGYHHHAGDGDPGQEDGTQGDMNIEEASRLYPNMQAYQPVSPGNHVNHDLASDANAVQRHHGKVYLVYIVLFFQSTSYKFHCVMPIHRALNMRDFSLGRRGSVWIKWRWYRSKVQGRSEWFRCGECDWRSRWKESRSHGVSCLKSYTSQAATL